MQCRKCKREFTSVKAWEYHTCADCPDGGLPRSALIHRLVSDAPAEPPKHHSPECCVRRANNVHDSCGVWCIYCVACCEPQTGALNIPDSQPASEPQAVPPPLPSIMAVDKATLLRECPFCGSDAVIDRNQTEDNAEQGKPAFYAVVCTGCGAGTSYDEETESDRQGQCRQRVVEHWNTRATTTKAVSSEQIWITPENVIHGPSFDYWHTHPGQLTDGDISYTRTSTASLTESNLSQVDLRLLDLVRYSRHDLHQENLITDEEFAALVSVGAESARRLESYDEVRATASALAEALRDVRHYVLGAFAVSGNPTTRTHLDQIDAALARWEGKGKS